MPDEGVLVHHAIDVSSCDVAANLTAIKKGSWRRFKSADNIKTLQAEGLKADTYPQALDRIELPLEVSVEGSNVDASGDVDALCEVVDVLQWSLDTVKDGPHDSWTQLHRERFPRPQHRISNRDAGWIQAQEKKKSLDGNVFLILAFYRMM